MLMVKNESWDITIRGTYRQQSMKSRLKTSSVFEQKLPHVDDVAVIGYKSGDRHVAARRLQLKKQIIEFYAEGEITFHKTRVIL